MVHYELALILRAVGKQELPAALRGVCTTLLQNGAILRKLENLGEKELPYKMSAHKERFTHGRYAISAYFNNLRVSSILAGLIYAFYFNSILVCTLICTNIVYQLQVLV